MTQEASNYEQAVALIRDILTNLIRISIDRHLVKTFPTYNFIITKDDLGWIRTTDVRAKTVLRQCTSRGLKAEFDREHGLFRITVDLGTAYLTLDEVKRLESASQASE